MLKNQVVPPPRQIFSGSAPATGSTVILYEFLSLVYLLYDSDNKILIG